jgi:hypothetical protein
MFDNPCSSFEEGRTMQRLGWTALAAALVLAGTGKSQAQDTIRLGGTGDATVQSLVFDGQADTEQVYWRGGVRGGVYWRGGGYRPYAGFYRPYVYRPFAYRPYYAFRPYFAYRPYAYSYYTPGYYYAPSYYGSYDYPPPAYGYYVNPISANIPAMPNAVVLGSSSYSQGPIFQTQAPPQGRTLLPPPRNDDGTFQYDGGPNVPMPVPADDGTTPTFRQKRPTVPLDGKLVSIPARDAKYSYPAYGEAPTSSNVVQTAPARVVSSAPASTARVSYPAYGDR